MFKDIANDSWSSAVDRHLVEDAGKQAPGDAPPRRELQLAADAVLVQKTPT